jgi:hypothetical protein
VAEFSQGYHGGARRRLSPVHQSMKRPEMRQLYRSPNGDTWFLARDPATGLAFVRHQANNASGGQVTDIDLDAFLNEPRHPQHEALLRLIGTLIVDPQAVDAEDQQSDVNTGREWSDAELRELGDMLLRGLSIEVIARLLRPGWLDPRQFAAIRAINRGRGMRSSHPRLMS